ncbi:MAG: nuclear transport factor 2 family protein, partial [Acidimicrobiia bacterium]
MQDDDRALLDRLASIEAVRQLVARYALATDSRDLHTLVGLFVDDVQVGGEQRGRAALRAFFDRSLRDVGVTILHVGNHIIDFDDPDHAHGVVYCRGEIQVDDRWIVQTIQYRDTYGRRDGAWYFVRRRHLLWYGTELGQSPLGLPPANWPEHHTGRGELPEAWDTWRDFWDEGAG